MNTARRVGFSSNQGSVTATLIATGSNASTTNTESWDGSSWTELNNVNTGGEAGSSIGVQTSGIYAGGYRGGYSAKNEIWDGTSWTESTDINTGRGYVASGGSNSSLGFLAGGLEPAVSSKTEIWNGSSWTEVSDLGTARNLTGQTGGTSGSGILAGGRVPPATANTAASEEWTAPLANKTITAS
jgi:hypothetical protein